MSRIYGAVSGVSEMRASAMIASYDRAAGSQTVGSE
jgi:hypothetical protein